jgi:hypothetical protein
MPSGKGVNDYGTASASLEAQVATRFTKKRAGGKAGLAPLSLIFIRGNQMPSLDVKQINANRKLMADSTIDSPYDPQISDSDADYGERLYGDNLPADHVGFMPPNERNRSKR